MQVITTFAGNNLTVGSTAGIGGGSYIGSGAAVLSLASLGSGSNKTLKFGDLNFGSPLGSPLFTVNTANGAAAEFNALTLIKDAYFVPNASTTINGNISGNGTLLKTGGNLFINSDNSATFKGGFVNAGGTTFFGTVEGNVLTLSDTAGSIPGLVASSNYGTGNALIQPATAIQFNSTSNLAAGAGTVDLRSNALGNYGILRMAANAPLSAFNVIVGNLGGPQDSTYFGLAGGSGFNGGGKNAGSAIIALNTVYTQALNLRNIGDGTAFLGSTTNSVGLNGSYNAATLGTGAANTYRLGAGGSTLYVSSDMANSNVLTNIDASATAKLIVGLPDSGLNTDSITGGSGRGSVVLMTNQNYTGATVVNRGSVLEFRGTLTTPSFDNWGTLTAGGLGGTFLNTGGSANLATVTLHPGSELRLDYSTGLLATNQLEGYGGQGRWADAQAITLDNATLRLFGNRNIEVTETVGVVTIKGFGQLAVQRDFTDRTVNMVIGGGGGVNLVRTTNNTVGGLTISGNNASLQVNGITGGVLGSDERVKLFSGIGTNGLVALGGVTNGMVAPWMVNGTDIQFLTYTADNGFVNAGFTGNRSGVLGTGISVPTERTFISAAASVIGTTAGLFLDTYALRADGNITFASGTPAAADRLQVRSGGLISNGAISINTGISFGVSAQEANIYNNNNLVIGLLASPNITGQITNATNIVKQGGGSLFIDTPQNSFSGNFIINQGALFLRENTNAALNNGGTASLANMAAGTGGLVVLNNFNTQLGFRSDNVGRVVSTFTSTSASPSIVVASATGLAVGMPISGNGIPAGTFIGSIASTTIGLVNAAGAAVNATVTQGTTTNNVFVANAGATVNLTASTVTNTTNVTVGSTAGLVPGMALFGPGVNGLTVSQITSGTTFTLSAAPTTLSGVGQIAGVLGTSLFDVGLTLAEGNHLAALTVDRIGATANSQTFIMNGGITFGGSPGEQGQTLNYNTAATGGSSFNLAVLGGLNLGPAGNAFISTGNNGTGTTLSIYGQVTGAATLIKTGGQTLDLNNTNTGLLNTNTGGIQVVQGTLNLRGTSTGVPITGATVAASTTVTVPDTTNLVIGMLVYGPGIPAGSTILTKPTSTTFTIGSAATAQTGAVTLTFFSPLNTFASGTPNILNNATSIGGTTARNNGGMGTGALTLYGGVTNLRYDVGTNDAVRQRFWIGNDVNGNSLIVNGGSTISIGANTGSYTNKYLAFKDMTIGSTTFNASTANTYVLEINGATNLTGVPVLNVTAGQMLLNGAIGDGAGTAAGTIGQAIIKSGAGELWINSTSSSFGGLYAGTVGANGIGLVVNGGLLRFGDANTEDPTLNLNTMLRGSQIRINPTGNILFSGTGGATPNLTFANGQIAQYSVGPQLSLFRVNTATITGTNISNWLSSDSSGVIALNVSTANALNLSTIGNGTYYLGAIAAATYTANSLTVGANNLYRIGAGTSTLTMDSSLASNAGVLTGTASVIYGSQGANGNGTVLLNDTSSYSGSTLISRSTTVQFVQAATSATVHPLGNAGQVDVFGTLEARTNGSFLNFAGSANQNTVVLHPGSVLFLNNNVTTQNFNRWNDGTAINLDGAQVQINSLGSAPALTNVETVGAVTYQKGAILSVAATSGGSVGLTTPSLTRTGAATLQVLTTGGTLGTGTLAAANHSNLVVSGGATAITPSGLVNTILPAYFVNGTDNTFLTYGANGFTNATYTNTFAAGAFSTNTTGASIVDLTTGTVTLTQDQTVYALRTSQNISSGVGQYNTLTFANGTTDADRGGLITTGTPTIATNLKFGTTGTKEGVIFNTGNTTLTGDVYAGSITKFGAGALIIGKDQTAVANGTGFAGNWTINQGSLTLNTFGGSGDGGTITLNSSSPTTGAGTTLNLLAQPGSSLNGAYTMGRIIAVDNAVITATPNLTDSVVSINDLEIKSTDTTGLSPARLAVNIGNTRSVLNAGTLFLTGTGGSIVDVRATAVNNQITSGATGSGLNVAGLNGSQTLTKWGNGYLWIGGNNTSFTGAVNVEEGAIGVTNANAFVNAGTITAKRYGVVDILTTGFTNPVTYQAGAIERWSVDNARSGAINLGNGSLQVNADQFLTTATVTMNGGSIEGFLRTDDVSSNNTGVVFRTLGSGVSISLAGNSFVGQNAFTDGPNGTDNGRTVDLTTGIGADTNNGSDLTGTARGTILEIKGSITGSGSLTKQSTDTVILSGNNTYSGGTVIADGTLRLGSSSALAQGGSLTTSSRGVLDMGGYNVSVSSLSSSATTATSVFASSSGFITNSSVSPVPSVLTVGVGSTGNYTYGGVIQNNVALTKAGVHTLTLTNTNTYLGNTVVNGGTLALGVSGSVNDSPWISLAANTTLDVSAKAGGYSYDGVITGGGVNGSHATINGSLTVTDHVGDVSSIGSIAPGTYTSTALSSTGAQIGHVWVSGNLTLSGPLLGTSTAVNRATFQLNGATTSLVTLGWDGTSDISAFIASLTSATMAQLQYIDGNVSTTTGGNLGSLHHHDYINVVGALTLNNKGKITVTNFGSFSPAAGDVYNLFDWSSLVNNGFNSAVTGGDINLPTLTGSLAWDTSQFLTHGLVIVTPEPSRVLLLMLGLLGFGLRRRRRSC